MNFPDVARASRRWLIIYWTCQVFGWGFYTALGLGMTLRAQEANAHLFIGYGLFLLYVIPITHLLGRTIRRREWLALPPGHAVMRILGAALVTSLVLIALVVVVQVVMVWSIEPARRLDGFTGVAVSMTMATLLWTAIFSSVTALFRARLARHRAVALELSMREARLKNLESQIGPHFLFNSLNSLRGMIMEDPALAQDMVTRLANILRHNLARRDQPTEPLGEQVEFTVDYLALESVRFEERLRTRFDISPETRTRAAPAMLLQTLVENAIKHGIAPMPEGGEIIVASHLEQDLLVVTVENSGRLAASPVESTRVGLANLRERLLVLHGPTASLELVETAQHTVRATARIPPAPVR